MSITESAEAPSIHRRILQLQRFTIAWMMVEAAVSLLAAWIAGALLIVLALFVAITSDLSLLGYREPQASRLGIAVLLLAAVIMPWLAREKRKLAAATSSAALRADAAESALCGYLAWIALAGVLLNALWAKPWADPLAALLLIPLILREGWEALGSSRSSCAGSE